MFFFFNCIQVQCCCDWARGIEDVPLQGDRITVHGGGGGGGVLSAPFVVGLPACLIWEALWGHHSLLLAVAGGLSAWCGSC